MFYRRWPNSSQPIFSTQSIVLLFATGQWISGENVPLMEAGVTPIRSWLVQSGTAGSRQVQPKPNSYHCILCQSGSAGVTSEEGAVCPLPLGKFPSPAMGLLDSLPTILLVVNQGAPHVGLCEVPPASPKQHWIRHWPAGFANPMLLRLRPQSCNLQQHYLLLINTTPQYLLMINTAKIYEYSQYGKLDFSKTKHVCNLPYSLMPVYI